jgi:hypothetical protein
MFHLLLKMNFTKKVSVQIFVIYEEVTVFSLFEDSKSALAAISRLCTNHFCTVHEIAMRYIDGSR